MLVPIEHFGNLYKRRGAFGSEIIWVEVKTNLVAAFGHPALRLGFGLHREDADLDLATVEILVAHAPKLHVDFSFLPCHRQAGWGGSRRPPLTLATPSQAVSA